MGGAGWGRLAAAVSTARVWVRAEWAPAARASVAMVLPLALAVAAGDLRAGLTMSLGAFAALYARREPYRRRARLVAAVGLGLVVAVVIGSLSAGSTWAAGVAIALVAAVATWAAQSSALGPPGAYMFTLAAAIATNLPPGAGSVWQRAAYVAVGAVTAWVVVMAGALVRPDAPQVQAVAAAYDGLVALLQDPAPTGPGRHAAAVRLRVAGDQLVAAGPRSRDAGRLRALHGHARRLFLLAARGAGTPSQAAEAAGTATALRAGRLPAVPGGRVEAEHFESSSRWHLGPHSLAVPAAIRVAVAALLAAAVASAVHLEHAYWAPAAAVTVLQATSARLTLSRAGHRVVGTVVGVLLAAGLFLLDPSPVLVVVAIGVLQFIVEVCIARVYAIGVAFLTPLALLIAESGTGVPLRDLLVDRLAETLLGCAVGIVVALVVLPRAATSRLPAVTARVGRAQERLAPLLDAAGAASEVAVARRDLVRALTALTEAIQAAKGELLPTRYRNGTVLVVAAEAVDAGWLMVTRPSRAERDQAV